VQSKYICIDKSSKFSYFLINKISLYKSEAKSQIELGVRLPGFPIITGGK